MIGVITPEISEARARDYLDELAFLAETAGAVPVRKFLQRVEYPNPRTFVNKGKIEEIAAFIAAGEITLAIFDDELTPSQMRNIENDLNCRIIDRTNLILDILRAGPAPRMPAPRWSWLSTSTFFRGSPACGLTSNGNGEVSGYAVRARLRLRLTAVSFVTRSRSSRSSLKRSTPR